MIHDPHHVAHLAGTLLSSVPQPEPHHVKSAVAAARSILDEAHHRANADAAAQEAADKAAAAAAKEADGEKQS